MSSSSVATLFFVAQRMPRWAVVSLAVQAAIGLVVLRFALDELSDRSDTKLIVAAMGIGFVGLCAVIASFGQEADT